MEVVRGVERIASTVVRGVRLSAARGSVVDYTGSALVNAANEGCVSGGGVDGAVNSRGGHELIAARKALPLVGPGSMRCETGDAKTTVAGDLDVTWVIHAVGPNYHLWEEDDCDALLYSAYSSAMREARKLSLPDVGFSLLSAGIFRAQKPLKDVLGIGLLAIADCAYDGLEEAFMVGYTAQEATALTQLNDELLGPDAEESIARLLSRCGPALAELRQKALAEQKALSSQPAGAAAVGAGIAEMAATAQPR